MRVLEDDHLGKMCEGDTDTKRGINGEYHQNVSKVDGTRMKTTECDVVNPEDDSTDHSSVTLYS